MGDFGVSVETKDSMMQASTFAGTWNYMAPEMLKGMSEFQSSLLLIYIQGTSKTLHTINFARLLKNFARKLKTLHDSKSG